MIIYAYSPVDLLVKSGSGVGRKKVRNQHESFNFGKFMCKFVIGIR